MQDGVPIRRDRVALKRRPLGGNIFIRPFGRVSIPGDRSILGREPKGVPADRVQHIIAAQHPVASYDVTHGKGFSMSHVQVAGGVREHIEHVFSWPCAVVGGFENFVLLPVAGPALLNGSKRKFFALSSGLLRCVRHDVLSTIATKDQIVFQSSILTAPINRPPNRMLDCSVPASYEAATLIRIDVCSPASTGTPQVP